MRSTLAASQLLKMAPIFPGFSTPSRIITRLFFFGNNSIFSSFCSKIPTSPSVVFLILILEYTSLLTSIISDLNSDFTDSRLAIFVLQNNFLILKPFEFAILSSLKPSATNNLDSFLNLDLFVSRIIFLISLLSKLVILLLIYLILEV